MGGLFHFEDRHNKFITQKKSKLLEMMKPEQKSRVDLEQISLGCDGPGLIDPRVYLGNSTNPGPEWKRAPGST